MRDEVTLILGILLTLSGAAGAGEPADCTVKPTEKSVALGIGVSWGHGELHCGAKSYRFKVSGISVQDVGASDTDATGYVYDLHDHREFAGTYMAATAGAVAGS